ncbi:DNA polymerase III subunit alpha [Desulfosudis oleivorans]|uniref:DNA-directed DNA polymerase n=1 Tax=Desulfosudis oleivorans (strain DSM 6200 / JCM 39069 / Hxd3) TaxID=96561 RepID=A8ZS29_DESOH|nr:DNA polymerase III subunit alpha [Desulfosudis oleivorans]ABW66047.1 DNA polymerase III, alpha subunit [Desulfosudis oleivorans Hxd3]
MIPLTVRSGYSLMWGTAPIKEVCRVARQQGYDRLALTDTDNLYGLWHFLDACRRNDITPVVGAELTDPATTDRAVLLVKNPEGYKNLCRLITARHLEPDFKLETAIARHADGLAVLTRNPCHLKQWHESGVAVYGAMPRRPMSLSSPLCQTARYLNVPLVATPGSFFLSPQDMDAHRMLRAIDLNTTVDRLGPLEAAPGEAWLASPREYEKRFEACPEALANTRRLSETLTFTGPEFGLVMPPWESKTGTDPGSALRQAAYRGAQARYGRDLPEPVARRLEHELSIIIQMRFAAYFLVVQDIVRLSPRICGRGSGAASLVAYCLRITNVCPIKHNLYFERFLNPGRKDAPDIDVDFAWDERDTVLAAVFERFGDHCAMVCNHVRMQPRMAVREVARVYGLTEAEISRVTKKMPWFWRQDTAGLDILRELSERPESRDLDLPAPWPGIMAVARKICGAPRYLSVHPGGVIITPRPVCEYVPVERAAKGVRIIQWEKDQAEDAGLVKIDLLGNRSLAVIRDAIYNLRSNNHLLDESTWAPEDDFATQEAVSQGKTMGCFYIESPATRLLQKKSRVGDFEHLVIHSSIIRPAANDYIQEYLRRLHGASWDPIHPLLADVLDETFGIMVYQEDVSRAAVSVAGFSHADADGLRKVMSKKDKDHVLADFYRRFADGAAKNGVTPEKIREIWRMMMSFSGYSFCKPHSASYARVSFQAAWLKTHYPAAFMAAVISNQGGFYSTFAYVSEARRSGITILAPDVNASDIRWQGNGNTIRVGLSAVGHLSLKTMEKTLAHRKAARFTGLEDYMDRVRPDEPEAQALIQSGAFDALCPGRSRSMIRWQWACWKNNRPPASSSPLLFDTAPGPVVPPPQITEDPLERYRQEFSVLGFLCDTHPMTLYKTELEGRQTIKAKHLGRYAGKRVCVAGWLITGKVVRTKNGDPMEFLTFEDETDIFEATFFPKTYTRFCHMIDRGSPFLLWGTVETNWGAVTLTVEKIEGLPDYNNRL